MATLTNLKVTLTLDSSRFAKGIGRVRSTMKNASRKLKSAGRSMTMGVTAPLAAGAATAVKEFADFEESIVEIKKVTDRTDISKITEGIKEMSEASPIAREGLANLAADAARFGVRGDKNILRVTETLNKLVVATDLSADTAAEMFAKITKGTGTPMSKLENLGSVVNELSNKFATTTDKITRFAAKSSGSAGDIGLAAGELAAMGSVLNQIFASSARAGTAFRRLSEDIIDPKRVEKFLPVFDEFSDKLDFIKAVEKNPVKMIKRLSKVMRDGGKEARTLKAALSKIAARPLRILGKNLPDLNRALKTQANQWEKNTSLSDEFGLAMTALKARFLAFLNVLKNAGDVIAKQLRPAIEAMMDFISRIAKGFQELSPGMKRFAVIAGVVVAAIGPLLFGFGVLAAVISATIGALVTFSPVIIAFAGAITAAIGSILEFRGSISETFKAIVQNARDAFSAIKKAVVGFVGGVKSAFGDAELKTLFLEFATSVNQLRKKFVGSGKKIESTAKDIGKWVGEKAAGALKTFLEKATKVVNYVKDNWSTIKNTTKAVFEAVAFIVITSVDVILTLIGILIDGILTAIRVGAKIISGDWEGVWSELVGFTKRVFSKLGKIFDRSLNRLFKIVSDKAFKMGKIFAIELAEGLLNASGIGFITELFGVDFGETALKLVGIEKPKLDEDGGKVSESLKGIKAPKLGKFFKGKGKGTASGINQKLGKLNTKLDQTKEAFQKSIKELKKAEGRGDTIINNVKAEARGNPNAATKADLKNFERRLPSLIVEQRKREGAPNNFTVKTRDIEPRDIKGVIRLSDSEQFRQIEEDFPEFNTQ